MKLQTRQRVLALLVCWVCVFNPAPALAADLSGVQARISQATELLKQGRPADALTLVDEAVGMAETQGNAGVLTAVLGFRMGLQTAMQDFQAAEASARRGYEASERAGATATPAAAMLSLNAATMYLAWGRPAQAQVWAQRTVAGMERLDRNGGLHLSALRLQAKADEAVGHYGAAIQHLEQAAGIEKKLAPRNPEGQIVGLLQLAGLRHLRGDEAGSRAAYAQALDLQLARPDAQRDASALASLAWVHHALGQGDAAATALERAYAELAELGEVSPLSSSIDAAELAKRRQASGWVHALRQIGKLERARGRLAEAEAALRRAMALSERLDGPGNLNLPAMQVDLGDVLRERAAWPAAVEAYAGALAVMEKSSGGTASGMPEALEGLARAYRALGDNVRSEAALQREIALYDAHIAADHPRLAPALTLLSELQAAAGREAEAKASKDRAAAILATPH